MHLLLKMAADLIWTVSALQIYFGIYLMYHKLSAQNIPYSLLVIYYSFLIIVNV